MTLTGRSAALAADVLTVVVHAGVTDRLTAIGTVAVVAVVSVTGWSTADGPMIVPGESRACPIQR